MAVLALAVLAVALTRQVVPIFAGLAVVDAVAGSSTSSRSSTAGTRRAVARLTRSWNLEAEAE